ncbi:MAG: hypothetical protein V4559_10755 [Pseudomonadota bacterium]
MITKEIAELLSPLLGAAGGIFLAIPFFVDYFSRVTRKNDNKVAADPQVRGTGASQVTEQINKSGTERVLSPEPWTALVSGLGCVLLFLSFLVLLLPTTK